MACFDRELLRLLPRVLRARDFHLYLENGKRLTDLWRGGGKAVLGHKPPRVLSELKNAAERGLFTALPHPMEKRFIKALAEFFPGFSFRLYTDESSLYRALEKAGLAAEAVSLWRPFTGDQGDFLTSPSSPQCGSAVPPVPCPLLIPVLPCPLGPAVLALGKDMEDSFPHGDLIPPVLLAPAARSLHDLAAVMKTFAPDRGGPAYRKIEKALGRAQSDGSGAIVWRRRGIYLTVEKGMDRANYEALFRRFLEDGFLLPPSPEEPAILPLAMSPGEESKLAQLLAN